MYLYRSYAGKREGQHSLIAYDSKSKKNHINFYTEMLRHIQGVLRILLCRWVSCQSAAMLTLMFVVLTTPRTSAAAAEWAEWTYRWEKLTIIVRTNVGIYSPSLQARGMGNNTGTEKTDSAKLMELARYYFVMTSAPRVDHTFEFIEQLAKKWGPGHALPILAAVAVENVQRPIPTLFGGPVTAYTFSHDSQLEKVSVGGIDPNRPGVLRITVYGEPVGFRRAAQRVAHASAKAYYDGSHNEVGLLIDMPSFRRFYGFSDRLPGRQPMMLSAFIAYAMDAFNEDSGHELAHVYQHQAWRPAYTLPAIIEGEAEVQGITRRRNGLTFNFLYNTPDAWGNGRFDSTTLQGRLKVIRSAGRPMAPTEVDRLVALKAIRNSGLLLTSSQLLGMDAKAFFSGTDAEIESRYSQSWVLCLLAIREESVRQILTQVIDARLANAPRADLESKLDREITQFIDDPHRLKVTKEEAWKDAERFYRIDPIFVGLFYMWIYAIDPGDMKALVYLGDALYAGGNLHSSMHYYLAAQKLGYNSALPLLRIGDVQDNTGDREAALRTWQDAEKTNGVGQEEVMYRKLAKERPRQSNQGSEK